MAEILWGLAWADHVEEADCRSLSGVEITDVMPKIPAEAFAHAERLAAEFEALNGCDLPTLYQRGLDADSAANVRAPKNRSGADRFGNCLAFTALGHGVSWFDDHAKFDLKRPRHNGGSITYDLRFLAEETCEECKARREA
jgi:hypothetical protein